ncbi:hypothetical protein CMV_008512 [Castanea mollissima]|uniref:Uncharacterized protein n=1 Tax=Castanea mollissima TaxID=60419 RepID=A0A8J4VP80_9ROSI|nr:hypothetical protein CMV_008512 [Castanea mollissima]
MEDRVLTLNSLLLKLFSRNCILKLLLTKCAVKLLETYHCIYLGSCFCREGGTLEMGNIPLYSFDSSQ